jgi:hypothetical protein
MPTDPKLPGSDDADPEEETTPAGQVEELEEEIAELGATFDKPKD